MHMTKLVLDRLLREKLRDVRQAELCDESGRTLGHYLSEEAYRHLVCQWANAQVTDEELERRRQAPGGKTLAQIWARLGRS